MARLTENSLLSSLTGRIGKQIVIKHYGDKTVVTAYPDMQHMKPSALQKLKRGWFKEAVAYAQNIIHNPELKKEYQEKVKKGESVYHYAIKEYLKQFRKVEP